jgi:hypothetical protein
VRRIFAAIVLAAVLGSTAACNKPVSPADTSPGALDVKISVLDIYPQNNDLAVVMQFLSGGQVVQFSGGETVTCNNVTLPFNALFSGYSDRVPQVAPGGKYRFVYTRNGTPTTVEVTAPARPVILTPAAGAQVTRTTSMTIGYVAGSGQAVTGGASDATSSAGGAGPNEQPDNGQYTGLNTTTLAAGTGSVSVARILRFPDTSTAFKSVAVEYRVSASRSVTWT